MAKAMSSKTRQLSYDPVLGYPKELSMSNLPTCENVLQYYLYVQQNSLAKDHTFVEISSVVVEKVKSIWKEACLPIVSHQQCVSLLKSYQDKLRKLKRNWKKESGNIKVQAFQKEIKERLFDISSCKCKTFTLCTCEKSRKVPLLEQKFLLDQRSARKMFIGNVDMKTTMKQSKSAKRKQLEAQPIAKSEYKVTETQSGEFQTERYSSSESDGFSESDSHNQDFIPLPSTIFKTRGGNSQMRLSLPTVAKTADRVKVSDRAAAMISNAVLEDFGIITEGNTSKVIDKSKMRRERKKSRLELQNEQAEKGVTLQALYFDGRKDKTLTIDNSSGKPVIKNVVEEHIVLLQEPGSKYIGHVTPGNGKAEMIASSITKFLNKNGIKMSDLLAVGCDGTAVNTGSKGGVITLLEQHIGRPLQWIICQLHGNELPLRHLLHHLDGSTTGPSTFSGIIGKQLQKCHENPVVNFEKVEVILPELNISELSADQKYLYQISEAVSSGDCQENLSHQLPGKLSHARWMTAASRVLRLYIGTHNPSAHLKTLVEFICKVYVPMWFKIKSEPSIKYGAKHLWQTVQLSRYLSQDLKNIVDPVIQRNGYFAHPENVLLAMLGDDREHIRQLGLRRIIKARSIPSDETRSFAIPTINFNASDYSELINSQSCKLTEPPLTRYTSTEDFQHMVNSGPVSLWSIMDLPCHSQAVERGVKLITEASSAVCGYVARDGMVRATLESRSTLNKFEHKSQYKGNNKDCINE